MINTITKTFILSLLLLLPHSSIVVAQPNQIFVGARPLSLGEAFVAVADDGNAIYWNPAGLANLEHIEANFSYANLYGTGIKSYYASFLTRPYFIPFLTDYITLGVDRLGIELGDDDGLEFNNIQYDFAIGIKPPKWVPLFLRDFRLGASRKYLKIEAKYDGFTEVDAIGWGWNLGMLYSIDKWSNKLGEFKFGFMIHDIGGTRVRHDNDVLETISRQHIRGGVCYRPPENWYKGKIPISNPLIAIDIDDRIHGGFECWLLDRIALRAGIQKDLHTDEAITFSFGMGLKLEPKSKGLSRLSVDYALTNPPVLPPTKEQGALSFILYDNPRLIRIEEKYVDNLYASLYSHYGMPGSKIGIVKVRNSHTEDSLVAKIHFKTNLYMDEPTEIASNLKIGPGQDSTITLRAIFSDSIVKFINQKRLTGKIEIIYDYKDNEYTTTDYVDFLIYDRNSIKWDDVRKVGAFVTKNDKYIRSFTDGIIQSSKITNLPAYFSNKMYIALSLYEALRALKVQYGGDSTPDLEKSEEDKSINNLLLTKHVIDRIEYPAELLSSKSKLGECDDLSILYITLLESKGIETAILDIPGHVFVMFNTEIPARRLPYLPLNPNLFVIHRGELWIPIETTVLPKSFMEAWYKGATRYYRTLKRNEIQIVDIADSRTVYPPAPDRMSFALSRDTEIPSISEYMTSSLAVISDTVNLYLTKIKRQLDENPDNHDLRNQYAVILAQSDHIDTAKMHLNLILDKNPFHSKALNNLGNIYFLEENLEEAQKKYLESLKIDNEAGVNLNLVFLYSLLKKDGVDNELLEVKIDETLFNILTLNARNVMIDNNEYTHLLLGLPYFVTSLKAEKEPEVEAKQDTTDFKSSLADSTFKSESEKFNKKRKWYESLWEKSPEFIRGVILKIYEGPPPPKGYLDAAIGKRQGQTYQNPVSLLWWAI